MSDDLVADFTLHPGQIWTATGRFAVDAARISVAWGVGKNGPIVTSVQIDEIHELNVVGRRHTHETRYALRRAAQQLVMEGIAFHVGETVHVVFSPHVRVNPRLRIRAFVMDDQQFGPFAGQRFQPNE